MDDTPREGDESQDEPRPMEADASLESYSDTNLDSAPDNDSRPMEASMPLESYTGTDLDPALDVDFDLDDWEEEDNGLMRVVALAAGAAAVAGLALLLMRRPKKHGLEAVADEVGHRAQHALHDARKAADHVDLSKIDVSEALDELRNRAQQLHLDHEVRDAVGAARRRARAVASDVDTRDLRRGADRLGRAARQRLDEVDTSDAQGMLAQFSEQVVGAIDRLRGDLAPAARSHADNAAELLDENLPKARAAARSAAENLQDLVGQGRKRGAKLVEDASPAVQRTAADSGDFAGKVGEMLQAVALSLAERALTEFLPTARQRGEEVAGRVKDDTFPFVRHRAADVADTVRGDVAPRLRKLADDAPDRVRDAISTARPVVDDVVHNVASAAESAGGAARSAVDTGRERAGGMAGDMREGISGSVVGARARANALVRGTRDTTGYLTKESTSLLFWLAMLGAMILFVFVPDKERQAALWNGLSQFLGEMRQMWTDYQGDDFPTDGDGEYTGDQA